MWIYVVDYSLLYIGVFLKHKKEHSPTTYKRFYVGYLSFPSEIFRKERVYGRKQLCLASSPFQEGFTLGFNYSLYHSSYKLKRKLPRSI